MKQSMNISVSRVKTKIKIKFFKCSQKNIRKRWNPINEMT